MSSWGIAEWYGQDIRAMSSDERLAAASVALETREKRMKNVEQPICPFLSTVRAGARCNKPGGVCSIRAYEDAAPVKLPDDPPAAVCPNRFLETASGQSIFAYIAKELFGVASGAVVVKEIPFLHKVDGDGETRSSKAGRIDWIVIPQPPKKGDTGKFDWIAVETQAVYFSGGNMWDDIELYAKEPGRLHAPTGQRRPDYRSSGAKRLAPQLDAKSPVMRRWGRKVAVVVDESFFAELAGMPTTVEDFENAEVVWVVMRFTDKMNLVVKEVIFAELVDSIAALQATQPMNRGDFETGLKDELFKTNSPKVHLA